MNSSMEALFIIVNAGYAEEVVEIARSTGVMGATILNARGESARHKLFMGITVDKEKEIILTIIDKDILENTLETIREKAGIKTPAHSICFTLPVSHVVGLSAGLPAEDKDK